MEKYLIHSMQIVVTAYISEILACHISILSLRFLRPLSSLLQLHIGASPQFSNMANSVVTHLTSIDFIVFLRGHICSLYVPNYVMGYLII
uniref:Uncharacterized protein n=1 Tax=Arundo donax TaxID=35708 RepID=A0A0A9GJ88_ARUDO